MTTPDQQTTTNPGEQLLTNAAEAFDRIDRALDYINSGILLAAGVNQLDPAPISDESREQVAELVGRYAGLIEKLNTGVMPLAAIIGIDTSHIENGVTDAEEVADPTPEATPTSPATSNGSEAGASTVGAGVEANGSKAETNGNGSAVATATKRPARKKPSSAKSKKAEVSKSPELRLDFRERTADEIPESPIDLIIDPDTSSIGVGDETLLLDSEDELRIINVLLNGKGTTYRNDIAAAYPGGVVPKDYLKTLRSLQGSFEEILGIQLFTEQGSTQAKHFIVNPDLLPKFKTTDQEAKLPKD